MKEDKWKPLIERTYLQIIHGKWVALLCPILHPLCIHALCYVPCSSSQWRQSTCLSNFRVRRGHVTCFPHWNMGRRGRVPVWRLYLKRHCMFLPALLVLLPLPWEGYTPGRLLVQGGWETCGSDLDSKTPAWSKPSQSHPRLPNCRPSWKRTSENKCCFMPLSFRVVCYIALLWK